MAAVAVLAHAAACGSRQMPYAADIYAAAVLVLLLLPAAIPLALLSCVIFLEPFVLLHISVAGC